MSGSAGGINVNCFKVFRFFCICMIINIIIITCFFKQFIYLLIELRDKQNYYFFFFFFESNRIYLLVFLAKKKKIIKFFLYTENKNIKINY